MRRCAKLRCEGAPTSTVTLRYADRTVVIRGLAAERDPTLLDLCTEHADSLTAPLGWERVDERRPVLVTEAGVQVEARSA